MHRWILLRPVLAFTAWALILLSLSHPTRGSGGESASLLAQRAAAAYEQGRYDEAAQLYVRLAASGGDGAETRYDLGNCYLKGGDLGRAILEYRRALKLSPRFVAAEKNLAVARKLLPARVAPWQPSPWEAFIAGVPQRVFQWLMLGFALMGNAALAFLLLSSDRGRRLAAGILVATFTCALLSGGALAYAVTVLPSHQPAVVVRSAPVFPSPEASGVPLVTLPLGSEVILAARAGDRALVMWGEGRGWTDAAAVEAP